MAAQTHALDLLALPSAFRDIERVCEHLGGAGHLGVVDFALLAQNSGQREVKGRRVSARMRVRKTVVLHFATW